MIPLDELIQYWIDRKKEHPPLTSLRWKDILEATIFYLQEPAAKKGDRK